jgi:O-antigen ligase
MLSTAYVYLLALGFVFLPFTKALTVDIGFPLKIYEVVFSGALAIFVLSARRVDRTILLRFTMPLLLFLLAACASYFVARYEANDFSDVAARGGPALDGAFRMAYLTFNILVMTIVAQATQRRDNLLYGAWQVGAVLSAFYATYCAIAFLRGVEPFKLPGIERHQLASFGALTVSRSGTFEEGNYAGLYFLISLILAWYKRHWPLVAIMLFAVFLTKSTAAYFALLVCIASYGILLTRSKAKQVIIIGTLALAAVGTLTFFQSDDKFSYRAGSSGGVRLNEAMTGIEMFKARPLLGFSLGGYGYAFYNYLWEPDLSPERATERRIPNMVYVEVLAETGLVGFFLFFLFWKRWLEQLAQWQGHGRIFLASGFGIAIGWLAFPTFNISFIWAFVGFSLGLSLKQTRYMQQQNRVKRGHLAARRLVEPPNVRAL